MRDARMRNEVAEMQQQAASINPHAQQLMVQLANVYNAEHTAQVQQLVAQQDGQFEMFESSIKSQVANKFLAQESDFESRVQDVVAGMNEQIVAVRSQCET